MSFEIFGFLREDFFKIRWTSKAVIEFFDFIFLRSSDF